ncbi:phosphatase PAP2 family protein [Candidatus Altiarchaeota archaeon]
MMRGFPLRVQRPEDIIAYGSIFVMIAISFIFKRNNFLYVSKTGFVMLFFTILVIALSLSFSLRGVGILLRHKKSYSDIFKTWRSTWLRDWLPLMIALLVFESTVDLVPLANPRLYDSALAEIDGLLFGGQISQEMQAYTHPIITEFLMRIYTLHLFIPTILLALFYVKGNLDEFRNLLLSLLIVIYLGLAGYFLVPAVGPYVVLEYQTPLYEDELSFSARVIEAYNKQHDVPREAFPSLHAAVPTVVLLYSIRYSKNAFWILLPITLLIYLATIYLRFHYLVDVIAGVALALLSVKAGERIRCRWDK